MSVKNKVIIITGASSGIGLASTKVLLDDGAKLAVAARHVDSLNEFAKEHGNNMLVQKTDVSDFHQVESLVNATVKKFGHVDVFFNYAGIMPVSYLRETGIEDWKNMVNVNIMGVLNGIAAVLPLMEKQGHDHILATDSTAGHKTFPKFAVYSGTKFAVKAIMDGLHQEEAGKNIKSTLITPGTTSTNLVNTIPDEKDRQAELDTQKKATLSPEDLAYAVKFAIDTPDNVSVNEINMIPTGQLV